MSVRSPLPLRVPHIERETAFSFMSRMASVNGTNAVQFGMEQDVSFQKVLDGETSALAMLAQIGGVDPHALAAWTPVRLPGRLHGLRGAEFPAKLVRAPQVRGCPVCLRGDSAAAPARSGIGMAVRGHWMLPHVFICLQHLHPLVPLWHDSQPISRYDTVLHFQRIAEDIVAGHFDGGERDATDFDDWMEARLQGGTGDGWLHSHPLHAAATFCFLLGGALMRLEGVPLTNVKPDSNWGMYQMGFEIAQNGPAAIRQVFQTLQDLPGAPHQGAKAIFPLLYDRLSRDYRDIPAFEPFRELLREHMLATWPLGIGDELLGEPVTRRRLHSVRSAAQEIGIDQRRLRKMLEATGVLQSEKPDAWAVFEVESARAVLDSLTKLLPAKSFAETMSIARSEFDNLVEDGILVPHVAESGSKNVWHPEDGAAFLASLLTGAEILRQAQHGWEHLSKSAARLKVRPGEIIRAIQDGRIRRVGKHMDFEGYRSVYVYHDEVIAVLTSDGPPGISLELFAKAVGIAQPSQLKRLIRDGHQPATRLTNPRTRAQQDYITPTDAEIFHQKFYTLRTVAQALDASWQSLSGTLRTAGVEPFGAGIADYGKVYLRTEVDALVAADALAKKANDPAGTS